MLCVSISGSPLTDNNGFYHLLYSFLMSWVWLLTVTFKTFSRPNCILSSELWCFWLYLFFFFHKSSVGFWEWRIITWDLQLQTARKWLHTVSNLQLQQPVECNLGCNYFWGGGANSPSFTEFKLLTSSRTYVTLTGGKKKNKINKNCCSCKLKNVAKSTHFKTFIYIWIEFG